MCHAYEGERNFLIAMERNERLRELRERGRDAGRQGCPENYIPSNIYGREDKDEFRKGWKETYICPTDFSI